MAPGAPTSAADQPASRGSTPGDPHRRGTSWPTTTSPPGGRRAIGSRSRTAIRWTWPPARGPSTAGCAVASRPW